MIKVITLAMKMVIMTIASKLNISETYRSQRDMEKSLLIKKMMDYAWSTKDDADSNLVSSVATRLEHSGAPYEEPLTHDEQRVIERFIR